MGLSAKRRQLLASLEQVERYAHRQSASWCNSSAPCIVLRWTIGSMRIVYSPNFPGGCKIARGLGLGLFRFGTSLAHNIFAGVHILSGELRNVSVNV